MSVLNQRLLIGDSSESPDYVFETNDIVSLNAEMAIDVAGDNLSIDTLTPSINFEVRYPEVFRPLKNRDIEDNSIIEVSYLENISINTELYGNYIDTGLYIGEHVYNYIELDFELSPSIDYNIDLTHVLFRTGTQSSTDKWYEVGIVQRASNSFGLYCIDDGNYTNMQWFPNNIEGNRHKVVLDIHDKKLICDGTTFNLLAHTTLSTSSGTLQLFTDSINYKFFSRIYSLIIKSTVFSYYTNTYTPILKMKDYDPLTLYSKVGMVCRRISDSTGSKSLSYVLPTLKSSSYRPKPFSFGNIVSIPDIYKLCEYIETDPMYSYHFSIPHTMGASDVTRIVIDYEFTDIEPNDNENHYIFSTYLDNTKPIYSLGYYKDQYDRLMFFCENGYSGNIRFEWPWTFTKNRTKLIFDVSNNYIKIDNTLVIMSDSIPFDHSTPSDPIAFFYTNQYAVHKNMPIKIYSVEFYDADNRKVDMMYPAINKQQHEGDTNYIGFLTAYGFNSSLLNGETLRYYYIPPTNYSRYLGVKTADNLIWSGHFTSDITKIEYGTPIWYYCMNRLVGKFYFDTIERSSRYIYKINAMSIVGILDKQSTYGGVYNGTPFSTVIDEIFYPRLLVPYTVTDRIISSGEQYIDTGLKTILNENYDCLTIGIHFKMNTNNSTTQWLFGNDSFRVGVQYNRIVVWNRLIGDQYYNFNIGTTEHRIYITEQALVIDSEYARGIIAGPGIYQPGEDNPSTYNLFIFAANSDGSAIGYANGELYSFYISMHPINKTFKRYLDLTPYARNSDYAGVMYDSISGSFFASSSETDFMSNVNQSVVVEDTRTEIDISYEHGIENIPVYGWLPADSKRKNLHQLLFAYNVNLIKTATGGLLFTYLSPSISKNIDADITTDEGSVKYQRKLDNAKVTEHNFYYLSNVEEVELFDNTEQTIAEHTKIIFDNTPIYVPSLQTTGSLVIEQSNVNSAVVSGSGVLKGKPYVHTQNIISKKPIDSGNILKGNEVEVSDCTLVNPLNSYDVLERVWNYKTSSQILESNFIYNGEKCGEYVSLYNAYSEALEAFISKMSLNASSNLAVSSEMVVGYIPTSGADTYTNFAILIGSGQWSVPSDVTHIKVILIGGAQGGSSGFAGDVGSNYTESSEGAIGGEGGQAGEPGQSGKIKIVDISSDDLRATYSYRCGVGGNGGQFSTSHNSNYEGQEGTSTIFGEYSSANGTVSPSGVINIFTGEAYGIAGINDGKNGGHGGEYEMSGKTYMNGEDVTFNGRVWTGGRQYLGARYISEQSDGGGAAVGNNGQDATAYGGGNGAHAVARTETPTYGQGGYPGHGGGGGGSGPKDWIYGYGGNGGAGGKGGDGAIIIYY